jgi:hypothetical protein
MAVRAWTA